MDGRARAGHGVSKWPTTYLALWYGIVTGTHAAERWQYGSAKQHHGVSMVDHVIIAFVSRKSHYIHGGSVAAMYRLM